MGLTDWITSHLRKSKNNGTDKPTFGDPFLKHFPRIEAMVRAEEAELARLKREELPGYRAPLVVREYFFDPSADHIVEFISKIEETVGTNPEMKEAFFTVLYSLPLPSNWPIMRSDKGRYGHCILISGRISDGCYLPARSEAKSLIERAQGLIQGDPTFQRHFERRMVRFYDPDPHKFSTRTLLYDSLGAKLMNKEGIELGRG